MWVMTTRGFYSVVQHRDEPTNVMVRARCQEDIDALVELIPTAKPIETLNADYAWRVVVSQADWTQALVQMSLDVDYPNFKNAVKSDKHHDAYMRVWGDLLSLDDRHKEYGYYDSNAFGFGAWVDDEDDWPEPKAEDTVDGEDVPITFVAMPEDEQKDDTVPFVQPPEAA